MNDPVRILVVGLPRMLREIVEEALAGADGMVLVGEERRVPSLAEAVRRYRAAFVVGDAQSLDPDEVGAALQAAPDLRVLAVSHDGRIAELHELRPHREVLGEASADRLLAIIREHATAPVTR